MTYQNKKTTKPVSEMTLEEKYERARELLNELGDLGIPVVAIVDAGSYVWSTCGGTPHELATIIATSIYKKPERINFFEAAIAVAKQQNNG